MREQPKLPEDPDLRLLAEGIEAHGAIAEVLDPKWRIAYITSELCTMMGIPPAEASRFYGISPMVRHQEHAEIWGSNAESSRGWWHCLGPSIVHDVPPGDPDFDAVFGGLSSLALELEPASPPPALVPVRQDFPSLEHLQRSTWNGEVDFLYQRMHGEDGRLLGIVQSGRPAIPATLAARLARGDLPMLERMQRFSEPARRPAAILFADLEASGDLSRRLSSKAYFELIRSLTDLIDQSVMEHGGITGKHAGDGASALFVVEDGDESAAARGAVEAGRAIRSGAERILGADGPGIAVNVGLHWGATLMIGQVSVTGRLEVTALGDEMNEAARIEGVARGGAILGSKPLVERLEPSAARELSIDPDDLAYAPLGDLGAEGKALRDAGSIAVVEL